MFAILRGANGRRHEVEFGDDPVTIDVAMSATTVQITMTAADPGDPAKGGFVTVAIPRDALAAAMAVAARPPNRRNPVRKYRNTIQIPYTAASAASASGSHFKRLYRK